MAAFTVGITLGDPAGIGPEVIVRALAERPDREVTIFGDAQVLARAAMRAGVGLSRRARVVGVTDLTAGDVEPGRPNDASGRAQVAYLAAGADAALAGEIAALVTAPLSKTWAARAGFAFPGHTEYLASRAGAAEHAMMFVGPRLRVTLATTHLPLSRVPAALTPDRIASAIALTARALRDRFGILRPRVGVAALNPHAGEDGAFGDEEIRVIRPGVERARARVSGEVPEATVEGPVPADAIFRRALAGEMDAVVALYHDQALIPVKLIDFESAVNVTLGLPFVRTSPDHGTAYDIAGTGRARAGSFGAALDLAFELAEQSGTTARAKGAQRGEG